MSGHVTKRCLAPSRSPSASLRSAAVAVSHGHYTVNHCTPTAGRQLFHYGRQEKPNQVPNLFVSFSADHRRLWFICNDKGWLVLDCYIFACWELISNSRLGFSYGGLSRLTLPQQ